MAGLVTAANDPVGVGPSDTDVGRSPVEGVGTSRGHCILTPSTVLVHRCMAGHLAESSSVRIDITEEWDDLKAEGWCAVCWRFGPVREKRIAPEALAAESNAQLRHLVNALTEVLESS